MRYQQMNRAPYRLSVPEAKRSGHDLQPTIVSDSGRRMYDENHEFLDLCLVLHAKFPPDEENVGSYGMRWWV